MEADVTPRMEEQAEIFRALTIQRERDLPIEVKGAVFQRIVVPTVLYCCEAFALNTKSKKRIDVLEMSTCKVTGVRWCQTV